MDLIEALKLFILDLLNKKNREKKEKYNPKEVCDFIVDLVKNAAANKIVSVPSIQAGKLFCDNPDILSTIYIIFIALKEDDSFSHIKDTLDRAENMARSLLPTSSSRAITLSENKTALMPDKKSEQNISESAARKAPEYN